VLCADGSEGRTRTSTFERGRGRQRTWRKASDRWVLGWCATAGLRYLSATRAARQCSEIATGRAGSRCAVEQRQEEESERRGRWAGPVKKREGKCASRENVWWAKEVSARVNRMVPYYFELF
jgi:hypothetical protein